MSLYTALTQVLAPFAARLNGLLTGYDGTVYSTPGEAVRTQINDLHVLIGDEPGKAIDSSAIGYGEDSNVEDALDGLNERLTEVEHSDVDGVPTEVRQAIMTLFKSAVYKEAGLTDVIAIVESWAATITGISLNKTSININGASSNQLIATTIPAGGSVTWTSSNSSVATVSGNGLVTGVGNGTCTITASCGEKKATCNVTVSDIVVTHTITNTLSNCTNSNANTSIGDTASYTGTITANSGYYVDDTDITVTMGGTDVTSSVLSNGVITIPSVTGNVVITASATDALYPLKNGTFTFSNGNTITVSNHNHVEMTLVEQLAGYADISDVSENTSTWNTTDNVKNHSKKFTIPANSAVVFAISNYTKVVSGGNGACGFNAFGTGESNVGLGINNLTAASGSASKTFTSDTDVGCLFAVPTFTGTYSFDVSFTVDGVKYV